jgi:coproporphyrinogen III oxidase
MKDLTDALTDEKKFERGRYVEFLCPGRGTRFGRVLRTFSRGQKKEKVLIGLFNPYTKSYGNRGGYRHYQVTIDKENVLKFYGKSGTRGRKSNEGEGEAEVPDS